MYTHRSTIVKMVMLCSFSSVYAASTEKVPTYEIVKLASFTEVKEKIKECIPNALCLNDIDDSLITAVDSFLKNKNETLHRKIMDVVDVHPDSDALITQIFAHAEYILVDPGWKSMIDDMGKKAFAVYGFTSRNAQSQVGDKKSYERVNDILQKLDIRFSKETVDMKEFKNGVFYCDPYSKGAALKRLMQKLPLTFNRVLLIDDRDYHHDTVQKAIKEWNAEHGTAISFLGVHYTAVEHMDNSINHEATKKQLDHLLEHKKYISEKRAARMLAEEHD